MKSNRSLFPKSPRANRKAADRKSLLARGAAVECLESRIAPAAVLSATKVAVFAPGGDLNGDGNFDPGDTILYTVTLTNAGDVDLTGVTFSDILDGNLIQGANVNVSPLAINDTYSAVANTLLRVGNPLAITGPSANVAGHVTDNDAEFLGDTFTIFSFEAASANGGTVSMVTSGVDAGSFSYLPAVGFTGTDTFHYTIKDKGLDGIDGNADDTTSVGTVTITVGAQKVWYVDSSYAGANGASDGRSSRPFTSLTALSTGGTADSLDGAGDIIFVHTGSGSYTSTIVLETSQTLQGQGTALTVGGFNLVTAGTAPVLAPGTGTAVTLGSGNSLAGFTIGNSQRDILGNAFGTLTVNNVTLNGTGKTLDLTNGTFAAGSAFNSVATTGTSGLGAAGHGLQLVNVHGSVNFGSTTIAGTEVQGIFVNNSDANITFGNTSVGSPSVTTGVEAIRFEANTGGTRSFGTLTLSASQTGGIGMSISDTGGTVSASGVASISNTASTGLSVTGGAAVSFGTLNLSSIGGNGIVLNAHNGTFNTGTGGTIGTVTGTDVSITGGTGAVTITEAITNTTGGFIAIDNHETGNVTFSGNLSSTGGASGISIINSNTGTFTFSGDTKTLATAANAAVTLTNNGGGTINFSNGGLAITTTSGAGINATGGGTISVTTGTNANTISSGTGTALTVANTNIGAGNLNFRSISANGGANGIVLNTTGNQGGLIVTGTDGADAGTVPDAGTGGTIQNTTGHGISLNSTENVRLGGMNITNNLGSGISGTTVNGFLLDGLTISGNGNDAATDESGINITDLTGSAAAGARPTGITNSTITNNNEFEVQITNNSGVLTNFQLTNNTISSNGVPINGNGTSPHGNLVNFLALGSASMTLTTSGGTYTGNIDATGGKTVTATALNVDSSGGSSSVFAQINGGTFLNNNVAVTVSTSQGGNLDFDVLNTVSTFSRSHALNLFVAASSTGTVTGAFSNNSIGTAGVENSGSEVGFGIRVQNEGSTNTSNPVTVQINNNTIRGMGSTAGGGFAAINVNLGIAAQSFTRTTNLTVTGNNVNDVYGNRAIIVQQNNTTAPGTINATITGNNLGSNISGNIGDLTVIRLRQLAGGTFNLTQTSVADLAAVNSVGGNTTTTAEISTSGTITFGQAAPALPLHFAPSADDIVVIQPVDDGGGSTSPADGSGTPSDPTTTAPIETTPIVIQPPVIVDDGILSQGELDSLVSAAIARWEATGLTQEQSALLHSIAFSVADLPGWYLGEAGAGHVTLDSNAAGNSWFIDSTPLDDSEFSGSGTQFAATTNGGAAGRIDALTTIMHELGHVLGLEDRFQSADTANLMYGLLHQSERRLPGANQAENATPHLASGDLEFAVGPINIGSLPVGKSVQIAFTGTIKNDISANTVTNQGTASSAQTGNVLTDDPGVAGTANPTVTAIDLPDVSVAVSAPSMAENSGGNFVYTFTRSGPNDFARTVNFSVGGTAAFGTDYTQSGADTFNGSAGTITFPIGASTVTVTLTPTGDTIVEDHETAVLTVTSGSGYDIGAPASATGTINNDDAATLTLSGGIAKSEGNSGTTAYTFTVTLNNGVQGGFSVPYLTNNGTATTADGDYVDNDGTLSFTGTAGETKTITVLVNGDNKVELDETFTVSLGTLTGASATQLAAITPSGSPQTGTITNDDSATVSIAANQSANENAGQQTFTITLSNPVDSAVTVLFNTSNGTATVADSDYTGITDQLVTFAAGSTTAQLVNVAITGDAKVEANEVYNVAIGSLTNGGRNVTLGTSTGTGTIVNDDSATVTISGGGSLAEGNSGTTARTFTVTLNNAVQGGFTLPYTTNDGTATIANGDYVDNDGTLTFAGTAGESKTITVLVNGDIVVEGDETFTVALGSITGAPAGVTTSGSPQTATIANDDTDVSVSVAPSSVAEDGAGNLVYTFTRSGVTATPLTVNLTVSGTAAFTGDYTQTGFTTFNTGSGAATVVFAAGSSTATVTIDPTADITGEPNETVIFTLGTGANYNVITPSDATGTIQNDDTTVTVAVSPSSVTESSGTLTYTFTRTGDTTTATTVNFSYAGNATLTNDYSQAGAATFASGVGTVVIPIGQSSATVVLTPVNDVLVEGNETAILTVTAGADYGIGAQNAATGTINDNDTATIGYSLASSSVAENGVNLALGFVLTINADGTGTPALARDVTFDVTTVAGGTATGGGTDYAVPTTVTFASGALNNATASANLAINNDRIVEGSETANLGLAINTDNTGGQVSIAGGAGSHTATINDNDTATIGFASTTSSAGEGAGTLSTNLVLTINADGSGTPSLGAAATFQVSANGGTATSGTDYTLPGLITFASGSLNGATQAVTLALTNDALVEGSETAILAGAMGSGTIGGQVTLNGSASSHTATITDNDTATIGFVSTTSSVAETAGTSALGFVLTINANGTGTPALARDVTFDVITVAGGTATAGGTDYALPTTVTFASGALNAATASANLTINNDTVVEGSEVANLGLAIGTDNTGGQVAIAGGAAANHAATITDNDTATIRLLSAGSSVAEGTASKDVSFELVITGNGTAGTGTLGSAVSVNLEQLINGTASLADITFTNPQTFTFAAGSASGQRSATIGIVNDTLVEGTEILDYRLSGLSESTGGAVTLSGPAQHTLTITDNDTATIGFVQNASSTAENGVPAIGVVLTITANGQVNTGSLERAVSLNIGATGGTAASGADYTFSSPQTITFGAGAASGTQNVAVTLNNDTVVEGNETAIFGATGLVDNTLGQITQTATNQHTLTITDNDFATVQFTQLSGSIGEASESANVGVTLVITANGEPNTGTLGQDVTVNVGVTGGTATGGGSDYNFTTPTTVTFAAGSASGSQSAFVGVINDTRVEGSETVDFALSSLSGLSGQVSLGAQTTHNLTITDNDTATLSFPSNFPFTPEASGTTNIPVVLTITANGQVGTGTLDRVVSLNLADTGAGSATGGGVDYSFTSPQTITFPIGSSSGAVQNGSVSIVDDTVLEYNEVIQFQGQNLVDGTGGAVTFTGGVNGNFVNLSIQDNETAKISFESATSTAGEAAGTHQVGVKLVITANGVEGTGTLGFNGTAVQILNANTGSATGGGTDYTFTSPQLVTFNAGEGSSTKFVDVAVVDDNLSEGNETVNLNFGFVSDPSERGAITAGTPTTHTVTIVDNDIDLAVTKTASTPTVVAGSGANNLSFTVTVANNGLTDATGVVISDDFTFPAGVTIVSATPSAGTFNFNTSPDGSWNVGNLAAGASATLQFILTVDSAALEQTISNTATITGSNEVRVLTNDDTATATSTIDRQVDVSVTLSDGVTVAVPGDVLTYNVGYTNNGPSDALGVVLTKNLPAGTAFNAAGSAAGWVDQGGGVFTLAVGSLAAGANGNAAFAVTVNNPAVANQSQVFATASIADDGTAGLDLNLGNNSASDTDELNAAPDLRISIVDDPTVAHRGGVTKYLVTYANVGNQDATGGFITMTLPSNTTFDLANSTGIWVPGPGGVYTLSLGDVGAGDADQTVAFAVKVNSVLPGGYNVISTTGTIGDDGYNGADQNPADNTETETTPLYQGIYVVAPGISLPSQRVATPVLVYDVATGELLHNINAYEETYRDSIRVAVGDINGDGYDDIITSTRTGSGRVRVFDGVTGERFEGPFSEIAAFTEKGAKGAFVASGDVTGDGHDDIIVGSGQGAKGQPHVRVFDGVTGAMVSDATPFAPSFRGGVRVAVGDVNGDGLADIIASQGFGGNDVVVTSGTSATVLHDLQIGGNKYKGGVFVATGDLDGDGKADLIVGRDRGETIVETFNGLTGDLMDTIVPFAPNYRLGARVAAADVNLDGIADIIVGSGGRNLSTVKIFNGADQSLLHTFQAFPLNPTGALFVAGSSPVPAQPGIIQQPA